MSTFRFKQFKIEQDKCAMKIGTDGVLLGAWADVAQASSILDIGTGTGILALMAAQRHSTALIHAVELETDAYQQAKDNVAESPWKERIKVIHRSIQEYAKQPLIDRYDAIISNPPFFEVEANTAIQDSARRHARNTSALTFSDLLDCVQLLLAAEGIFSLVLPLQEGLYFIKLAKEKGFFLKRKVEVIPRMGKAANRLLIELVKYATKETRTTLIIRNEGKEYHDYTEGYVLLLKDFYLYL